MAAGLFIALVPMPARADNDEDSRHGRENDDRGIRAAIAALQSQVTSLRSTVSGLQGQVKSLQNSNTSLQNQLTAAHNVLALAPFVCVDPNPEIGVIGPNIVFSGVNIYIVSGSSRTDDNGNCTGLGNLIIGYDEDPCMVLPNPLQPGDRGGSHNLVIGSWHRFTQAAYGGFLAGQANLIANVAASVSGGQR
jgi:hypothetical protein